MDYQVIKEEKCWTYELKITFNGRRMKAVTITDYYQKKEGRKRINDELIFALLMQLDGKRLRPTKYPYRKVFRWETSRNNRSYRLIFWFKDGTTDHLWIRNCYQVD